jgi:hypothetical protein
MLMVGVTMFVVTLGWWCFQEVIMAHERKAALATIRDGGGDYQLLLGPAPAELPFIRQLCGDAPITTIWLPKTPEERDAERIKQLFPEAQFLGK